MESSRKNNGITKRLSVEEPVTTGVEEIFDNA